MRKLEESLASLRSAAREYAAISGRANVLRLKAERWRADAADESAVAMPEAAQPGVIGRVVTRLRAMARNLLGSRWR